MVIGLVSLSRLFFYSVSSLRLEQEYDLELKTKTEEERRVETGRCVEEGTVVL